MEFVERVLDGVQGVLRMNPSTLSGAVDVLVVKHKDGSLRSTPFYARFGKMQLIRPEEKVVFITVNGVKAPFQMKLGAAGEAFFLRPINEGEDVPISELTSPLPSPPSSPKLSPTTTPQGQLNKSQEMIPLAEAVEQIIQKEKDKDKESSKTNENPSNNSSSLTLNQNPQSQINKSQEMIPLAEAVEQVIQKEKDKDKESSKTNENPSNNSSNLTLNQLPDSISQKEKDKDNTKTNSNVLNLSWDWGELPTTPKIVQSNPEITVVDNDNNNNSSNVVVSTNRNEVSMDNTGWTPVLVQKESQKLQSSTLSDFQQSQALQQQINDENDDISDGLVFEDAADLEQLLLDQSPKQSPSTSNQLNPPQQQTTTVNSIDQNQQRKIQPQQNSVTNEEILELSVQFSMCASQLSTLPAETLLEFEQKATEIFDSNIISFDSVASNPAILFDANLMSRINGKLCSAVAAMALVTSMIAFRRKLTTSAPFSASLLSRAQSPPPSPNMNPSTLSITNAKPPQPPPQQQQPKRGWRFWPFPARSQSPLSQKQGKPNQSQQQSQQLQIVTNTTKNSRKYVRPTQEQLEQLQLHDGENSITFSVQSGNNIREVRASVYVFDESAQIVVSDIDGTITKSDALGHVFNAVGRDWTQSGVAKLFSAINANGYNVIYLTSRCIGVATSTRKYIASIRQKAGGGVELHSLPPGPVFMSPLRLLSAIDKELVRKTPQEFKIACLTDILGLFPSGTKPLYAGFGNRETDTVSYLAVGINEDKIFIINHLGNVRTSNRTYKKTYSTLNDLVDDMFPPLDRGAEPLLEQFNDANYWSIPLPTLNESDLPPPPPPKPKEKK